MRPSAFHEATKIMVGSELTCPHCGKQNLQPPAKPSLEPEQNGSYTCSQCGTNWTPTKGAR